MNSIAAMLAGIKAGADWLEFDVRRTKDGVVMVTHDANTFRTTIWPHNVARTKYKQLAKAKTYRGTPIPTLTDVFKAVGSKAKMIIEIKTKGCAETVVDHIERVVKAGANYDRFIVISFKPERLREIHRLNDHINLGLLQSWHPLAFTKLRAMRLSTVGFWSRKVPQKAIEQAKVRGLSTFVYTVNNHKKAAVLAARGIDRLVTDRPDKMQDLKD